MKFKFTLLAVLLAPLAFTACSKQQDSTTTANAQTQETQTEVISAEQQAAIDAIDQPIMDKNNTDVPAEVANAPVAQ